LLHNPPMLAALPIVATAPLPRLSATLVWLYYRFALSYRNVEEMMAARGITLTDETICKWCLKFGHTLLTSYAAHLPGPEVSGTWVRCSY